VSRKRVLIVAYYFPPIGGIGSIRLARFASFLPDNDWDVTVLAPGHTPHASDPHLTFPEDHVVRSRSIEFSRVGRTVTLARTGSTPAPRSLRGRLRGAAHRYAFFPDAQIGWYPGAVAAGMRALRSQRFDVIYSSAYPLTAHLVARTLSRRSGLPWVAESRDPLAARLPPDHPHKRRSERLERAIAREATVMVMPTPTWAAHYGSLWGTDVEVLPNGTDGDFPARSRAQRPTLAHVGTYYPGKHDLSALWQALLRLRERDPATAPRVRFVGHLSPELQVELGRYGLVDMVESVGFLPHDEALRELMSATMLVASGISGTTPFERGWVPAKLFDYLASGLPVLYLSDRDTDAARLFLGQPGCHVVAPTDADGALQAIEAGLSEGDHRRAFDELTRAARAHTLASILDRASTSESDTRFLHRHSD
jgi:glycosyltransferase involved in cell wall biosynthesis